MYHTVTLLVTSHGKSAPSATLQSLADALWLSFVYTVACMIPIPVMQFINFFLSKVTDNVNILKINVKLKHQFTAHFEKILHKLPVCTLIILTLTIYTCNHMAITIQCIACQEIFCHVIENVFKTYVKYKRNVM